MVLKTLITLSLAVLVLSQPIPVWTDNCLNVTAAGTCAQCADGFYLEYFLCLPCAPLCLCSSQYNYCESCTAVTYKHTNYSKLAVYEAAALRCVFCQALLPFCLECTDSAHCTKCYGGFFVVESSNGSICSNSTCKNNCEICHDDLACEYCQPGYYLDPITKSCSPNLCQQNCRLCAKQTTCQTCLLTYFYSQPQAQCLPCIPNCLQCKDQLTCDVCAPGYYTDGLQGCVNSGFTNCTIYYPNASAATDCQVCAPGYFVLFGSCNQCVGCELCSLQFLCQSPCLAGSTPFNYACLMPFVIFESWLRWGGVLVVVLLTMI